MALWFLVFSMFLLSGSAESPQRSVTFAFSLDRNSVVRGRERGHHAMFDWLQEFGVDVFILNPYHHENRMFNWKRQSYQDRSLTDVSNLWIGQIGSLCYGEIVCEPKADFFNFIRDFTAINPDANVINDVTLLQQMYSKEYLLTFQQQLPFFPTFSLDHPQNIIDLVTQYDKVFVKPWKGQESMGCLVVDKNTDIQVVQDHMNEYDSRGEVVVTRKVTAEQDIVSVACGAYEDYRYVPSEQELELVAKVWEVMPEGLCYLRLDVTGPEHSPVINEIDVVTPYVLDRDSMHYMAEQNLDFSKTSGKYAREALSCLR